MPKNVQLTRAASGKDAQDALAREFTPEQAETINILMTLLGSALGTEDNPVEMSLIIRDREPGTEKVRVRFIGGSDPEDLKEDLAGIIQILGTAMEKDGTA